MQKLAAYFLAKRRRTDSQRLAASRDMRAARGDGGKLPDHDGDGGDGQPRETFVLIRGEYDKPGEQVSPGLPASLPPLPDGAPNNRLGFARWLVRPSNPLTARVAVNRFWQMFFGTGLVKTVGRLRLARRMRRVIRNCSTGWRPNSSRSGWDVKAMQRDDRDQRDVSAVVRASTPELLQSRSGESPARARSAVAADGRNDPRSGAGRQRAAGRTDRRAVGQAVSAGGPVEGNLVDGHGSYEQDHGDDAVSPQHVHLLETHRRAADDDRRSTPPSRETCTVGERAPTRRCRP